MASGDLTPDVSRHWGLGRPAGEVPLDQEIPSLIAPRHDIRSDCPKGIYPLAERRFSTRKRRRYLIEWQSDDSLCTGFTHDISPTGIFIRSTYIAKIGATLTMQLLLPGGGKLRLRGIVVRSHHTPQHLRGVVPSGFAVQLKEAPEEYYRLLATLFGLRFAS